MNNLIGNTPMIKIKYKYNDKINYIYAKLEYYNLTGSIKDRMVYYIIQENYKKGLLKKGTPIIEATSGNTGISLAAIGSCFHNPVYIFMPDWVSVERKSIMEMFGANVFLVSKKEGGFKKCIELADQLCKKINGFRPNQFSNILNMEAHYHTTGNEIVNQVNSIDAFVCGIGTGGTLFGVNKRIREKDKKALLCAIEPEQMPLLKHKKIISNHQIDGIGDDFIPDLVDEKKIDRIIDVNDIDAIRMSQLLSTKLGLGVGISSGANFLGSIILNDDINGNIVTIFPDDNKKYISTNLNKKIMDDSLISNKIELISYESV